VWTKTPGLWMAGVGVRRFEAAAKYSSLHERTVVLRAEEARFVVREKVESILSAGIVSEAIASEL
jgi:hypothetical protein